jgi:hypothetical protein
LELVARLTWESNLWGFSSADSDREKRAIAVIQTIDYLLMQHVDIPMEQGLCGAGGLEYYFPIGWNTKPVLPTNAQQTRDRLIAIIRDGTPLDLLDKIPDQHQCEGLGNGIQCRAMVMLGGLGNDPQSEAVLLSVLQAPGTDEKTKCAAFCALLMQGNHQSAEVWYRSLTDWNSIRQASEILLPNERQSTPGGASIVSTIGRDLDSDLVRRFKEAPDPISKAVLAEVLSGRVDNPSIRQSVITGFLSEASEVRIAILRNRPALIEDRVYSAELRKLVDSSDFRISSYALTQLSLVPDLSIRDMLVGFLGHEDPRRTWQAVQGLEHAGKADPLGTMRLVESALGQHHHDSTFNDYAHTTISRLTEYAQQHGFLPTREPSAQERARAEEELRRAKEKQR